MLLWFTLSREATTFDPFPSRDQNKDKRAFHLPNRKASLMFMVSQTWHFTIAVLSPIFSDMRGTYPAMTDTSASSCPLPGSTSIIPSRSYHRAGLNNPTQQVRSISITKHFSQPAVTFESPHVSSPLVSDRHPKQDIPRNRGTLSKLYRCCPAVGEFHNNIPRRYFCGSLVR